MQGLTLLTASLVIFKKRSLDSYSQMAVFSRFKITAAKEFESFSKISKGAPASGSFIPHSDLNKTCLEKNLKHDKFSNSPLYIWKIKLKTLSLCTVKRILWKYNLVKQRTCETLYYVVSALYKLLEINKAICSYWNNSI